MCYNKVDTTNMIFLSKVKIRTPCTMEAMGETRLLLPILTGKYTLCSGQYAYTKMIHSSVIFSCQQR